jgi:type VI secretion system secreted protein Hcp
VLDEPKEEGPLNKLTIAGLSLLATVAAATSAAAETVSLELAGQKQGNIAGEASKADRRGQIDVLHLDVGATSPVDAASGQTTGRRRWSTLKFVKPLDVASPKILNAFATSENLTKVIFHVYRNDAQGREAGYYTIQLTNAVVVSDQVVLPSDKDPATGAAYASSVEIVSLTFQKISVTYVQGGIAGADTWQ